MYTLLIADDEPLIRNGVKKMIDWESLGFSEIFLAEDGQEALDIVRTHKVDLVLTDIVMPFMDGLELSRILTREFPDIHIVILTGHEDFEYARQSVDVGVENYILKPAGAETMYKKMKEICDRLHIENRQKQYISSIKKQLNQSVPALRSQLLNRLICTQTGNIRFYLERAKSFQLEFDDGPFQAALVEMDRSQIGVEDYDIYMFAAQNIIRECLGERHFICEDGNDRIVILFQTAGFDLGEQDDSYEIIYQTLEVILKAIDSFIKIKVTCAVGSVAQTPHEFYESYQDAKKALECKYSLGDNSVYDIRDLDYVEKEFFYPTAEIKELVNCVKFQSEEDVNQAVKKIISTMSKGRNLSISNMKMIYIEIITGLMHEIANLKTVSDKAWNEGIHFYQSIEHLGTPREMHEKLLKFAEEIRQEIQSVQTNSSTQIIENVKAYVAQNYKDTELSLSTAAESVSVSTGYLSGLFKKAEGINFVKYLTDIRMEKAMEFLLHTDMKTYEIAYETGFANPHYFSVSFKKYTGMSPSDFRQKGEK